MAKHYRYSPLAPGEIRLVRFGRKWITGNLHCAFQTVKLDNLPVAYTAISYCWGSPDRMACISCPGGRTLPITQSAIEVGDWLSACWGDLLWVDFLCIDQDNPDEKANQVALMGRIFSHSQQVRAWLGAKIENGKAVEQLVTRMMHENRSRPNAATYDLIVEKRQNYSPSDLQTTYRFLLHPWFRRLWVVQEMVVANNPTIYFNDCTLPWHALGLLADLRLALSLDLQPMDSGLGSRIAYLRSIIYSIWSPGSIP